MVDSNWYYNNNGNNDNMNNDNNLYYDASNMNNNMNNNGFRNNNNNNNNRFPSVGSKLAPLQSCIAGAAVGLFVIAPFAALHHFVVFPSPTGFLQWEWDTVMAAVQGSIFASAYQYAIRGGDRQMRNAFIVTCSMIRTAGVVPIAVGKSRMQSVLFFLFFCRWIAQHFSLTN